MVSLRKVNSLRFWLSLSAVGFTLACGAEERAPVANVELTARPPRTRDVPPEGGLADAAALRDASASTEAGLSATEGGANGAGGQGSGLPYPTDQTGDAAGPAPGPGEWNEPGSPSVLLATPEDSQIPDEVYNDSVPVSCRVTNSDEPDAVEFDPSTVQVELLDITGTVLETVAAERTDDPGVFETSFPALGLPSGPVHVRCTAQDNSEPPKTGETSAQVFIDHGPEISIVTPIEFGPESALGAVRFEYLVAPDELVVDDEGAAVEAVTLSILGERFELLESEDEPGSYRTSVDFFDEELFAEAPSGEIQVAVAASNARGITRTLRYVFVLDGSGPSVNIVSPGNAAIVGGAVSLHIQADDALSAVDWDTLVVNLNDVSHPYDPNGPWQINGNTAIFTFESADVTGSVVQLNVNAIVDDEAGNTSNGSSVLYYRDEYPPIVTLDPPPFRVRTPEKKCSLPFDPLGVSPANGEPVEDIEVYRALVVDQTNTASGGDILHLAYVNRGSVDLFARRPDAPLVVDTNGDAECDDIAVEGTRFQELGALTPAGDARFSSEGDPSEPPAVSDDDCALGDSPANPPKLCPEEASDLTIAVGHAVDNREPLVYAVSPDNSLECTGRGWELRSAGLADYQGWVCLAARAYDNVGNRGVSAPIAVCLDNDQVAGVPDCAGVPPDCTDGCTPAPALNPAGVILDQ